jgi:hypothetical protein
MLIDVAAASTHVCAVSNDTHAAAAAAQHPQVCAAQHAAAAGLLHCSGPCTAEHHLG